jgi:hypothetical protein
MPNIEAQIFIRCEVRDKWVCGIDYRESEHPDMPAIERDGKRSTITGLGSIFHRKHLTRSFDTRT